MTNVHDVFYPSTNRLHTLVQDGEYFVSTGESLKTEGVVLRLMPCRRNTWMMYVFNYLVEKGNKGLPLSVSQFNGALESFKSIWERRNWRQSLCKHLVTTHFHYVRLYTFSFAFQAHIQRASDRAKQMSPSRNGVGMGLDFFPRRSGATPDAIVSASLGAMTIKLLRVLLCSTSTRRSTLPGRS